MDHHKRLTTFVEELALLQREVEAAISMGHVDIATICESVLCDLLKHLYSLPQLRNLNHGEKKQYPAIDLADDGIGMAFQVTATTTLAKVKETLLTFLDNSLEQRYSTLIVCMLRKKQGRYSQASIDVLLEDRFEFDVATQIWDFQDLANQASRVSPDALRRSLAALQSYTCADPAPIGRQPWEPLEFGESRGLGPALLGRGLGPLDVGACPKLDEVDIALRQLEIAFAARISGAPGVGKSLCAYQVAHTLAQNGRQVYRLRYWPDGQTVLPTIPNDNRSVDLIVDDAHLLPTGVLDYLEERATEKCLIVSTVNEVQTTGSGRHAVSVNAVQAVKTIAEALRASPSSTLRAVMHADDRVGEGYGDVRLADRIDEAVRTASYPWQFCFVLGGGWRRAKQATTLVEQAGHGLTLTAIALRQLASRDASLTPDALQSICAKIDIPSEEVAAAVHWLADHRLILSGSDIRCPHQRLAAVFLGELFARFEKDARREGFITLFRSVLTDSETPMIGPHLVMDSVRFADALRWQLPTLLDEASVAQLVSRCWSASTPLDRSHASMVLDSLDGFVDMPIRSIVEPNMDLLARWIAEAKTTEGVGIARLMNNIWNEDEDFARAIIDLVPPAAVANAVSQVTIETIYSVSELIDRLSLPADSAWKSDFRRALDTKTISGAVAGWTDGDRLFSLAKYCNAISNYDDELALELVRLATPVIQRRIAANPIDAFEQLHDVFGRLLRVWDPLRIYIGKLRPTGLKRRIARSFLGQIEVDSFAATLSSMPLRDFEPAARLISVVKDLSPRLFEATVSAIDWAALEATLADRDRWMNLPREPTVFLCQLAKPGDPDDCVAPLLERHANQILKLDSRLAIAAPNVAFTVIENGHSIGLARDMTFGWPVIAYLIQVFGEKRSDLLATLLMPHEASFAEAFTKTQVNTFHDIETVVVTLESYAPTSLDRILDRVPPDAARASWEACLRSGAKAQRGAAALIEAAAHQDGDIADVARDLRQRFPTASIPDAMTQLPQGTAP